MISNLDIEREVAKAYIRHLWQKYSPELDPPRVTDDLCTPEIMETTRYWINLIDRVRYEAEQMNDSASTRDARYDAEQTLDGQIEERPLRIVTGKQPKRS